MKNWKNGDVKHNEGEEMDKNEIYVVRFGWVWYGGVRFGEVW